MPARLLLFSIFLSSLEALEPRIVVHSSFPSNSVRLTDLRRIFLKKSSELSGTDLEVVQYRTGSEERRLFSERMLGISEADESLYWRRLLVSSGTIPPKTKINEQVMVKFISRHEKSIGYVLSLEELPPEIKVLQVSPK